MAHRCIKPQCPRDCSECNHALPEEDEAAMMVCDLLDDFAVDGFGAPLEDGESELVDRWRAWLATRRSATLPEVPTCTKSQTPIDWSRVERAESLDHVTPTIDCECKGPHHRHRYHDWENGEDGNPERCGKCGLSFMRYVHSCCP